MQLEFIEKTVLKDARYYRGYKTQKHSPTTTSESMVVAKWDSHTNSFWYLENIGIGKISRKLEIKHLDDVEKSDKTICFFPVKEVIPREEFVVD
jgi:hypothetical protein